MKIKWIMGFAALAILTTSSLVSCNQGGNEENTGTDSVMVDGSEMSVVPVADSKQFPGAALSIASITSEKVGVDSAKITVKYNVENFELTAHTDDMNAEHMANSAEGQHIHFILDNTPYAALYKPEHSVVVPVNSDHYLLSFLSRSYHESIKEEGAAVLKHFNIDADGALSELDIPSEPGLFYSRPKGEYVGADTQKILLDFYLWNTDLSDGNKVQAQINDSTFTLDQWGPYEIQNAPKGELNITLSLVDAEGNALSGDNVSVNRKITLKE